MERIKGVWNTFVYVTTLVVLASAVYITVFWKGAMLGVDILWQILGTSLACSLGVLAINPDSGSSGKRMLVSDILYYLYVNGVVLGAGFVFQWFYISRLPMVAGMITLIAVVLICVKAVFYFRDKALAARIMERLEEECKSE